MALEIYEIPHDIDELFENGERSYRIINYNENMDMDNNQSMIHFMGCVGIHSDNVIYDYGTQIILTHSDYENKLCIDSGGLGDFYSHGFDVSIFID